MRRVGVLMGIAESDPAQQSFVSAFTQALRDLGWHDGRNIRIDYRWGAGDADKIQTRFRCRSHNTRGRRMSLPTSLMGWPGRAQRPNLLDCGWEA
jgi:hypothetical protein